MGELEDDALRRRLARKRASARAVAIRTLKTKLGIDEDAEAMVDIIEEAGLVIEHDECRPDHRHHTNPHRGCILR